MPDYIYLLREREFIKTNESIYKIGKSRQENLERAKSYPTGSELVLQITCLDCDMIERELKIQFKNKYIHKKELGNEYFEGNHKDMIQDIYDKIKTNNIEVDVMSDNKTEQLYILIDKAILSNEVSDIAKIAYLVSKENIKAEDHKWYKFDKDSDIWLISSEGSAMRIALSTNVCMIFVERAHYYNCKCETSSDKEDKEFYQAMSKRCCNIALRLKNTNYKDDLMKILYSIFVGNV
jgi:hypothetical protein